MSKSAKALLSTLAIALACGNPAFAQTAQPAGGTPAAPQLQPMPTTPVAGTSSIAVHGYVKIKKLNSGG